MRRRCRNKAKRRTRARARREVRGLPISTSSLKKAQRKYRRFWGVDPSVIHRMPISGKKNIVLVALGKSPALNLADGPKGRHRRRWRRKHSGRILVSNLAGNRLAILDLKRGIPEKPRLKFAGHSPVTEYIPHAEVEKRGSFKRGKHWVHKHDDEGGKWPKVYTDQNGNVYYAKSTYRVKGKWLHS